MELLTKKELAMYLKISTRTLDRLIEDGLPHIMVGGQYRFKIDMVMAWLGNGRSDGSIKPI